MYDEQTAKLTQQILELENDLEKAREELDIIHQNVDLNTAFSRIQDIKRLLGIT